MAATINTRQLMLDSSTFRTTESQVVIAVPTISEFIKLETTGLLSPASIALNATAFNLSNPSYVWERRSNDPAVTSWTTIPGATGSTLTVTNTDYSSYLGTEGTRVSFRVTCKDSVNTDVLSSSATQVLTYLDESKDAIVVTNSAPNVTVVCDAVGTPIALTNTGIKLQLSKNGNFLTYGTTGANTWNIGTPTQVPTNSVTLGTGSITDSNLSYTYSNITGLTADEVVVTFPITVRNSQNIARNIINVTQKFVKNKPGSTYELTITGGIRTFTYDQAGANPTPAATAYAVTLTQNGTTVTPGSYSWTTGGQLTGTGSLSTFTPSVTASFSSTNTFVQCTVTHLGNTITRTIPISINRIGTTGSNGKTYELTITGGVRSFTYDKDGLFPIPASTAFGVTLTEDGASVTPASYNWSTGGQLSSTGTLSTFTPVVANSFSGTNTFVQCTVTYAGNTITRSIPISISRIGSTGNNGKTYELTITGGIRSFTYDQAGANPSPAATAYSVTLTEDGTTVTPSSYEWTTGGQLTSTGAGATFTPTVAGSFVSSSNTFVQCKVVYAGNTITRSIPIAINRTGSTGTKTVQISAYQWSSSGLPSLPTTTFSYTWSNGTKNPTTLNNNWSFTAIAPTANNQTLYEIVKVVTETNGEAVETTGITFAGASSNSIGFRQDGTIGTSVKTATTYIYYQTAQATSTGIIDPVFGTNPYNFTTGSLTFQTANGWALTPPTFQAGTSANNYWYKLITISQTDTANQVVTQGTTLLGTSFTNLVTFTSLSTPGSTTIDGANITTGTINAQRITTTNLSAINSNLGLVNIGASGSSLGYVRTLNRNYGDTSAGFFLGYDSTAYKFELSNSDRSKLFQFDSGGNAQIKGVDLLGGQTAYNTGTGFFLGSSGTFSVGTGPNSLRFDGTTLTVPAVNITGTIPATVTHSGNVTGSIDGNPVGTVVGNASNGATAFTGTAAYRTNSAPSNNGAFSSITQTNTADGNVVVRVDYTYTQGTNLADSLILFYREGGGTVAASDPAFITNAVGGYITFTLKPGTVYSFGIQAVRRTESGLVGTGITTSTPNITTNAANYTGSIDGNPVGTVVGNASNGATAFTGTAAYRTNSAPTNNGVFGSITQANTADGNVVVTVNYTYTQGANIADSLVVFYREGGGTVVAADPAFLTNAVGGFITFTLKPGTTYTFGIQAVRRTESGLVGTAITTSSSITTNAANYTGSIDGNPVGTVVGNASNGATAFTGTAAYRTNSAPSNNGVFGSITQANTADGNVVVTVNYTYTQGANIADSLIVFYREGGGTVVAADPAFLTNAVGGFITFTLKPGTTYTFGIQAVRRTESGLVGTAITTSSSITTNAANYTGNIDNIAASTVRAGAADGASALSTVNNPTTGLSTRLSKSQNDILQSTITLQTAGTLLVGTANDGVYLSGSSGLLAKKSGATTFQITTGGDATFSGTLSVGTTVPVITGTTISSGAGCTITNTGNFAVGNTTYNLVWNGTDLRVKGGFRVDNTSGYINLTSSLGGVILEVDDNNLGMIASSGSVRIINRSNTSIALRATAEGAGVTYGVIGGVTGSGANFGIDGSSSSTSGTGVRGQATAASGTTYGVQGTSSSGSGRGVEGSGGLYGVIGTCSTNAFAGNGVRGVGTGNASQGSTGVLATSPYMALEVSGPSYFSGGNCQKLVNTFFKNGYTQTFENAQGTAPFAVTSTTKVTNLQADSVDGLEIVGVAAAGTGTANFGNTTKPTATVTQNVWLQVVHNGTTYYIPAWA